MAFKLPTSLVQNQLIYTGIWTIDLIGSKPSKIHCATADEFLPQIQCDMPLFVLFL